MREIKKLLRLSQSEYYETHLSLINCILPEKLTPMEIKVIASFLALEGDIAQYRFGPSARKVVMKELEISAAGLSNYIGSLLRKGFLIKSGDIVNVWPLLIPEEQEQMYLFKLQKVS